MNPIAKAAEFYDKYAKTWAVDSAYFLNEGFYKWMASKLPENAFVLEIGCGVGYSTEALLQRGHRVISLEENPSCLNMAYDFLKDRYNANKIRRSRLMRHKDDFGTVYKEIKRYSDDSQVTLLDGNILINDPHTVEFLEQQKFDAIVCWLIGTSGYILGKSLNLESLQKYSSQQYRLVLQNSIYDKAINWLRPGGILHFVDRGEYTTDPELITDFINSHINQASTTRFKIIENSFDQIPYESEKIVGGISMGMSLGTSGRIPANYQLCLQSICAILPETS